MSAGTPTSKALQIGALKFPVQQSNRVDAVVMMRGRVMVTVPTTPVAHRSETRINNVTGGAL